MLTHACGVQELLRARHITMAQVGRLEEAWKADPAASLDTLSQPSPDEEPAPVALKYAPSLCCAHLHLPCCFRLSFAYANPALQP